MSLPEAAASQQVFVLSTSHLQTAAVFSSYGWEVANWVPLDDGHNGRRRAQFEIMVPDHDMAQAQMVERCCANNMRVAVPDVGAYNRAFQRLKREIEDEDMRIERSQDDE